MMPIFNIGRKLMGPWYLHTNTGRKKYEVGYPSWTYTHTHYSNNAHSLSLIHTVVKDFLQIRQECAEQGATLSLQLS